MTEDTVLYGYTCREIFTCPGLQITAADGSKVPLKAVYPIFATEDEARQWAKGGDVLPVTVYPHTATDMEITAPLQQV